MVFAGLLLTTGSISDRVGRKWVYLVGLGVFAGSSALAAWSSTTDHLVVARACMGAGAAAIMPSTLSILINVFGEEKERSIAIGVWSGIVGLGVAVGPVLGGSLLDHFWWGSVFLINVPIAIAALIIAALIVPNSYDPAARRPDPVGSILSIAGLGLLVWGIIELPNRTWTRFPTNVVLLTSLLTLGAFMVWERRNPNPMLPMELFKKRELAIPMVSLALMMFALLGMFFLMTQYLQFLLGFSPLKTGLSILPVAITLLLVSPLSIVICRRVGLKTVVIFGMLMIAFGLLFLSRLSVNSGYTDGLVGYLSIGVGAAMAMAPSTSSVMESLPLSQAGVGSASNDTALQVGGALGVGVIGTALNLRYQDELRSVLASYSVPSKIEHLILGSFGTSLAVAHHLPKAAAASLVSASRRAFMSGMSVGMSIAAVAAICGTIVVAVFLPRPHPTVEDAESSLLTETAMGNVSSD